MTPCHGVLPDLLVSVYVQIVEYLIAVDECNCRDVTTYYIPVFDTALLTTLKTSGELIQNEF